ncbi:DUF488 domain-containing protein [Micromonospora auratinigra]|uniref:DUF488 domain-containing protein n=1 Tax=Micromonospora auratinigra TaxID=261654 RepID=A0A1A8YZH8_9ACTN|nr:DUF488 domain-containing protein [Micromonospora auratinigra]SBT37014.1 Protein of unknown function, DUF488 [Micromonospora auratinigra]
MGELLTVGHGAADRERLGELLAGAGIALVVDVRRYPASRTNPDVRREELADWLPARGIDYRWEPRLGGRRHVRAGEPEPDTWWTVPAFRAYAAYTRTADFDAALDAVLADAARRSTTVLCSESVWWRCHRRLIADVAVLVRGVPVRHLMSDGRLGPHRPAEGARRLPDGHLVWDG